MKLQVAQAFGSADYTVLGLRCYCARCGKEQNDEDHLPAGSEAECQYRRGGRVLLAVRCRCGIEREVTSRETSWNCECGGRINLNAGWQGKDAPE